MAVILDYTGVSILANKGDGTTEDVTSQCTFDPPDGTEVTTPGRILVKATYTENAGTDNEQSFDTYFEIGVGSIVRIDVTQTPDKMAYYVGELIDLTGMVVTAFLSDGTELDVTADCTTIPPDGTEVLTEGHIIVDVLYKDGQGAGQFELTAEEREIIDGGDWWTLWSDGELKIFCEGNMPNYGSPSSVPWYAHRNEILTVTIEDTVTSIGVCAFFGCTSLASVTVPDGVTTIGESAFHNCTSLASVTIPDSVTTIGYSAFQDCTSLASVTVPDGVTTIGVYAFSGCTSLASVTIPDSVTTIGSFAFSGCTSLASVTIPDGFTSIVSFAFSGCTSLASVTIPDTVTVFGTGAFDQCTSLSDVYYTGTQGQWEQIYIGSYNTPLTSATIHYNSTGPT